MAFPKELLELRQGPDLKLGTEPRMTDALIDNTSNSLFNTAMDTMPPVDGVREGGYTPLARGMILAGQPQAAPSFSAPAPTAIDPPEVAVAPQVEDPNFISRLGSFFNPSGGAGPALPQTLTPPSAGAVQAQAGTDIAPASLESLGLESPQQRILQESAASGAIEDPFGVTQAQIEQAGNADFGRGSARPSLAPSGSMGTVPFDSSLPVPQVSQADIAGAQGPLESSIQPPDVAQFQSPTSQGLTTAGGQPLSEFLAGGTQLLGRGDSGAAGEAAMQAHGELAGTRARPDGTFAEPRRGVARGPDSTDRAAGELSMADAVDLAGGDREKARAMVVASRQPKKEDTRTPEKIESDRLAVEAQKKQNEILDQEIARGRDPNSTPAEKESAALAQGVKDGTITPAQANEAKKQKLLGKPPGLYDTWAEYELATMTDADGDGKVATEDEGSTPSASTTVDMIAPDGRKLKVPEDQVESMIAKGATKA